MTMNPGATKLKNIIAGYDIIDIVLMSDTWYPVRKMCVFTLSIEMLNKAISNNKWRIRGQFMYMYEKDWEEVMKNVDSKA